MLKCLLVKNEEKTFLNDIPSVEDIAFAKSGRVATNYNHMLKREILNKNNYIFAVLRNPWFHGGCERF